MKGLYANIHAKRERIAAGSKEKMRKPGAKGAPSAKDFKEFGSRAEQLSDMRMGDQLQPLRDLNNMAGRGDIKPSQIKSYNQAKTEARAKVKAPVEPEPDPDADIKAKLPD